MVIDPFQQAGLDVRRKTLKNPTIESVAPGRMEQHREEQEEATMGGDLAASGKSSTLVTSNYHDVPSVADKVGKTIIHTVMVNLKPPPTVDEATMKARAAAARAYALSGEPSKKRTRSAAAGPSSASTVHPRIHANNHAATFSQSSLRGGRSYSNHYPHYPYVYPPRRNPTDQQNRHRPPPTSGWTSVVDPSTGRTYYANSYTGASSWDPPPAAYSYSQAQAPGPRCAVSQPQLARLQDAAESTSTPANPKTTIESAASPSVTTAANSDTSTKTPTSSRNTATKIAVVPATELSLTTKQSVENTIRKTTAKQVPNRINKNTGTKRPPAKSIFKKTKVARKATAEAKVSFLNCNNDSPHDDTKLHQKQPAAKSNSGGTGSLPPKSPRRNVKSGQNKNSLLPSNGTPSQTSQRGRNLSAIARLTASSIQNAQPKILPPGCDARLELEVGRNRGSATSFQSSDTYVFNHYCDEDDEEYANFVKSLGLEERSDNETSVLSSQDDNSSVDDDDDDEEDFSVTSPDDDDDDDDGKEAVLAGFKLSSRRKTPNSFPGSPEKEFVNASPVSDTTEFAWDIDGFDPDFYDELEDELGGLEEEDLEAAVASLLGTTSTSYAHAQKYEAIMEDASGIQVDGCSKFFGAVNADNNIATTSNPSFSLEAETIDKRDSHRDCERREPTTPLRTVTCLRVQAAVTQTQVDRLQTLLNRHYQALIQQAVLSIHAASKNRTKRAKEKGDFLSRETYDDIAQILDASIGMVQDLDQNRKDAIRNSIQLETAGSPIKLSRVLNLESDSQKRPEGLNVAGNRADENPWTGDERVQPEQRRLTRAAFTKTLQQTALDRKSVFNVKGLHRLRETFHALDLCHNPVSQGRCVDDDGDPAYTKACRSILKEAGANYEEKLIPGILDLSEFFSTPQEFLGDEFDKPCSEEQKQALRKDRNLFTSGEDNLVLRGVNLYGEKQWLLVADRYLPTRPGNTIAQRYSKLCLLLYLANGISVDHTGNLQKPPKLESVEDIDNDRVAQIKRADPPAILNVHRWSLEEDLTLLRAVPFMGHMWAELGARLIPHRDRGHLRKRYQVLQRRVKTAVSRSSKIKNPILKLATTQKYTVQHPEKPASEQRQTTFLQPQISSGPHANWQLGTSSGSNTSADLVAKSSLRTQTHDLPSTAHVLKNTSHFPRAANLYPRGSGVARMPVQPVATGDTGGSLFALKQEGEEDGVEWSHISRIQELMDDNVESEIMGAGANRLSEAKEPMREKLRHTLASSRTSRSRGCAISTVLERAKRPGFILPCQDTKRKSVCPISMAPGELPEKKQETPKLRKRPGSPDAAALFAAADASRLHGVNFGALESRHGGEALEQDNSSFPCDHIMEADAVSALNSLSSSPARSLQDRLALGGKATNARIAAEKERVGEGPSFFAQAVGGVHQRDKKKRRK